ncbi:tetr bacterial regulatory protein hth signature [Lucifera butyrica]|uniref:Tetr bacterial regulatory protein hth signature n=1 Tax=Lucifera butyrica TaxID=1351585 RepID=A0A498R8F4_9FIRM|nr:TetR/AcrR family transcriptional regulator [Lucifera butyrica]VBB07210.1 tetr bacterial regulatory protein hth signature [Lucifera butyrica]
MRYKDADKKERIIIAAIQLINEVGLAETSMSKIAKNAGVSAGTIYVYFENKEDMIKKLFLTVKTDMQQKIFRGIDGSLPIEVQFKQILKNYMDYVVKNKDYFLFFEQYINSPLIQKLCKEETQIIAKPLIEFFERGKEQGIFKQIDTNLIFIYAFSPLMQIAKKHFNGEFEFTEQKVDEIIQMSWDSIKA